MDKFEILLLEERLQELIYKRQLTDAEVAEIYKLELQLGLH